MGEDDIWKCMVTNIDLYGINNKQSIRQLKVSQKPQAHFSGSHWNSRKANENVWFDPYDEYQVNGTNQFCQTFSMMYLCDKIPPKENNTFEKYYKYTLDALLFIKIVINKCVIANKAYYLKLVDECLKYPNICLNAIEFY